MCEVNTEKENIKIDESGAYEYSRVCGKKQRRKSVVIDFVLIICMLDIFIMRNVFHVGITYPMVYASFAIFMIIELLTTKVKNKDKLEYINYSMESFGGIVVRDIKSVSERKAGITLSLELFSEAWVNVRVNKELYEEIYNYFTSTDNACMFISKDKLEDCEWSLLS